MERDYDEDGATERLRVVYKFLLKLQQLDCIEFGVF